MWAGRGRSRSLRPGWDRARARLGEALAPRLERAARDGTGFETSAEVRAAAVQVGAHVQIELDGGGDVYLAWTPLGDLADVLLA